MFLGGGNEIQRLKGKIEKLQREIELLRKEINYRDQQIIDIFEENLNTKIPTYVEDIFQRVHKNAYLLEEALEIVKDNQIEIGEIRNNQINIFGDNTNTDHDHRVWNSSASNIDLAALTKDLSKLRFAMRDEASEAEHDIVIGEIALAEKAATEGNSSIALKHLEAAGTWALDVAKKIGVGVAVTALEASLGL